MENLTKELVVSQFENKLKGKPLNEQGKVFFEYMTKFPKYQKQFKQKMNETK
jgi:hypothetical protein